MKTLSNVVTLATMAATILLVSEVAAISQPVETANAGDHAAALIHDGPASARHDGDGRDESGAAPPTGDGVQGHPA